MSDIPPLVLVVDSDPAMHEFVAKALCEDEYALLGALSVKIARKLSEKRPPSVLVVEEGSTDPMDALVEFLQAAEPHLRVIVVAAAKSPSLETSRLASFGPVLIKPLDEVGFRDVVRNMVRLWVMANNAEHDYTPMLGSYSGGTYPSEIPPTRKRGAM